MISINNDAYSIALFELAMDDKKIEKITKQIKTFLKIIKDNKDLVMFLNNYGISKEDKKSLLLKIFKSFDSDLIYWLCVIIDNNKTMFIEKIINKFIKLSNDYSKVIPLNVYSTIPLSKQQKIRIEKIFLKKFHAQCELSNIIDENIIGGIKLEFNSQIFDNSVRGKLLKMKSSILERNLNNRGGI